MASVLKVDTLRDTSGNAHTFGKVLQFKTAFTTGRQTIASTGLVNITGLSISITPTASNSLMLIQAAVPFSKSYVLSFAVLKNGSKTLTDDGGSNNNEDDVQWTYYEGDNDGYLTGAAPIFHHETAGNTTARTYTIAATSGWSGGTNTMYINNRSNNDMASCSYMYVWEIAQ